MIDKGSLKMVLNQILDSCFRVFRSWAARSKRDDGAYFV